MEPFNYWAATDIKEAFARMSTTAGAEFIAGGTDMLQLLQERVRAPKELIDLNGLPLSEIEFTSEGVRIGALARLAAVAANRGIKERFPAITQALLASASPQVRNMATIAGNLLQRTRCLYFRDVSAPCNKREPGSGCPAIDGINRSNALFGGSPHCIATYPGDLAIALLALDARVEVARRDAHFELPLEDLHRLPQDTPEIETNLRSGDILTAVRVPASDAASRSHFLKLRDRASFEWALVSVALALTAQNGKIRHARVAVGGVATKPWRLRHVEQALLGAETRAAPFHRAAGLAAEGAEPRGRNQFKVALLKRAVERALAEWKAEE